MFEYIKNLNLDWHEGRDKRAITDHIQIHHTVGDYTTAERLIALHNKRVASPDYRGIEYSIGVSPDGTVYELRGLEYKHGAIKNSLTKNVAGIGAADRSVSVVLLGDMRDDDLPTEAQMAATVRLVRDLLVYYKLQPDCVYGHNEIPPYGKGQGHYTECPVINMNDFRTRLSAVAQRDLRLSAPFMRGSDVKALQERLIQLGYDVGKSGADSIYGPATDKAVRMVYYRSAALMPGVVDANMRLLLGI